MRSTAIACLWIFALAGLAAAQSKSVVGTVSALRPETAEVEVKPENAAPLTGRFTTDTVALRVAPGETDLKKAAPAKVTDVAAGDRVLLTVDTATSNVRRIVIMSATDIAKKNEADRQDWAKRGITGIVAAKNGNEITIKTRAMQGEAQSVVTVGDKTTYKRYAPDSVKFADARNSSAAEISVGDQLRARGQKSEDGSKVAADEVVFGTFLTKGGSILAVSPEANEIKVKELGSGKTLTIKITADSQLKRMPEMPAMAGAMPGGRGPAGGPPPAGRAMGGGRGFDLTQMLDHMPPTRLEDLKPGETIVVSSTKGAKADELTAITLLGNAGMLIQMASAGAGRGAGMNPGMGGGGMVGGGMPDLNGMGLGGILP